jgi:hypothetical protein
MISLEAVVLLLTIPVLISLNGVDATTATTAGLGLAFACFLTAAMLRMDWAYYLGHVIQVAAIGLGFLIPTMFVLGVIFAALWVGAIILGGRIDAAQRAAASDH